MAVHVPDILSPSIVPSNWTGRCGSDCQPNVISLPVTVPLLAPPVSQVDPSIVALPVNVFPVCTMSTLRPPVAGGFPKSGLFVHVPVQWPLIPPVALDAGGVGAGVADGPGVMMGTVVGTTLAASVAVGATDAGGLVGVAAVVAVRDAGSADEGAGVAADVVHPSATNQTPNTRTVRVTGFTAASGAAYSCRQSGKRNSVEPSEPSVTSIPRLVSRSRIRSATS